MRELFHLLKTKDITPNSLYLLYCLELNLKLELPIAEATEVKRLQLLGMLTASLQLTSEAELFMLEVDKIFSKEKKKVSDARLGGDFTENLLAYRDLFPTSKVAGKLVRNSVSDLEQRMAWFMKTYPEYTWENIFGATRKYIESHNGDYKYCMTSAYFIKKDDKNKASLSLLSSWCEAELEEDSQESAPPVILGFNKLI
jgi:hypothetical protein